MWLILGLCFADFQVKDLKRQVRLERKRADQLQQKLQETLSESRAKQSKDWKL